MQHKYIYDSPQGSSDTSYCFLWVSPAAEIIINVFFAGARPRRLDRSGPARWIRLQNVARARVSVSLEEL